MGIFKNKKTQQNPDWDKDIKRNSGLAKEATQQNLTFEYNPYKSIDLNTLGTKQGLRLEPAQISPDQIKILQQCRFEMTATELLEISKRSNKTKFKNDVLNPLIECGFFERTIPDKPKSPKQKYRPTGQFMNKRIKPE